MNRLIIVPQYPTQLRYQDWWWSEFPRQLERAYDKVIVLGASHHFSPVTRQKEGFAPLREATLFEVKQIEEYMKMELMEGDTLLLNDLSFPGLFSTVLMHKRPDKCFAICHATSKNLYDHFAPVRSVKQPIERALAKLFNKIFVATQYHARKLGWENIEVTSLPPPPEYLYHLNNKPEKKYKIVSVARPGLQKRDASFERQVEEMFGVKIITPHCHTWQEYYKFLASAKVLLITAREETFGYQVIDAILSNCIPIAPNRCSYPELLPRKYLYDDIEELRDNIAGLMMRNGIVPDIPAQSLIFFDTIIRLMYGK